MLRSESFPIPLPHRGEGEGAALDDLVLPGENFAEAGEGGRRQRLVNFVDAEIDLVVGQREETPSPRITLHEKWPDPLHLEHPEGLGDAKLLEPVDIEHALDAATV